MNKHFDKPGFYVQKAADVLIYKTLIYIAIQQPKTQMLRYSFPTCHAYLLPLFTNLQMLRTTLLSRITSEHKHQTAVFYVIPSNQNLFNFEKKYNRSLFFLSLAEKVVNIRISLKGMQSY